MHEVYENTMDTLSCLRNKTRTMIREDTELKNFPLYCPKCKKETIINVQDMKITLADSK